LKLILVVFQILQHKTHNFIIKYTTKLNVLGPITVKLF